MKEKLSDIIYKKLKGEILNGPYNIEGFITEQVIADRYSVSRSPAREVLARLCEEGFVTKYPKKGYVVNNTHGQIVRENRQLRYMLELGVASFLIVNASDEQIRTLYDYCSDRPTDGSQSGNKQFHKALVGMLNNNQIVRKVEQLIDESSPNIFDAAQDQMAATRYAAQHRIIVDSILSRDIARTADAIYADLNMVISLV